MSTIGTPVTPCPALQEELVRYFNTCPATRRVQTPTLIWTNSPINKSGISQLVQPVTGKKRTVQLTYTQPAPVSDVTAVESCDKVCTATTEQGDNYATYTIDCTDGLRIERKVNLADWNESCKSDGTIIFDTLVNMLDGLIPAVAEKQAAELNPLLGTYSNAVDPSWLTADDFLEVATKDANDKNDPAWFERVNAAKVLTGFCAPTLITGGIDLWTAWRLLNVGCCTQDGLDALAIAEQFGEAVVYDYYVAQEFGNNVSLMLQSNSIQLLTATWGRPALDISGFAALDMTYRNYFETVVADPITGIPVDLIIKEDCGDISIIMTATTKTVGLPNDLYPAGHPMEGVTFANGIQVTNP